MEHIKNSHTISNPDDLWFLMDHKLYMKLYFLGKLTFLLTEESCGSMKKTWDLPFINGNSTSSKRSAVG